MAAANAEVAALDARTLLATVESRRADIAGIVEIAYFIGFWGTTGQTIGMMRWSVEGNMAPRLADAVSLARPPGRRKRAAVTRTAIRNCA